MLNQRQLKLLKILIQADTPVSSELLSVVLGTTQKTIRQDMKSIDELLKFTGGKLLSKTGSGYQILVKNNKEYQVFVDNFQEKYIYSSDIFDWNFPRIKEIITLLVFSNNYLQIDDIAGNIFVSRTTIINDLKIVKEKLNQYNLELTSRTNLGLKISGKEIHKRMLFSEYLNLDENVINYHNYKVFLDNRLNFYQLKKKIIRNLLRYDMLLNNSSIDKFIQLIQISYHRYLQGDIVEFNSNQIEKIKNMPEFYLARDILMDIFLDEEVPLEEQILIAIFLISRRIILESDNFDIRNERLFFNLSGNIIEYLFNITNIDFTIDPSFRIELANHLRGMLVRLEFGIPKSDIPLLDVKNNNPSFEYAVLASSYIMNDFTTTIPENEIAYLAYVIYNQFEKQISPRKLRLLIIFSIGRKAGEVFSDEVLKMYGYFIEKIHTLEYYQLDFVDIENYDCILTDLPASMFNVPISVHRINYLFQSRDRKELYNFFSQAKLLKDNFLRAFSKDLFYPDISAQNQEEVIRIISNKIKKVRNVPDDLAELILEREALASTENGNIVATPHALTITSSDVFIAVGKLRRPIIWNKEKVQLVIIISNGLEELVPFSTVAYAQSVFSNLETVYNLNRAKDFNEFQKILDETL